MCNDDYFVCFTQILVIVSNDAIRNDDDMKEKIKSENDKYS